MAWNIDIKRPHPDEKEETRQFFTARVARPAGHERTTTAVAFIASEGLCQLVYRKVNGRNGTKAGTDLWKLPFKDVATKEFSGLLVQVVAGGEQKASKDVPLTPLTLKAKRARTVK